MCTSCLCQIRYKALCCSISSPLVSRVHSFITAWSVLVYEISCLYSNLALPHTSCLIVSKLTFQCLSFLICKKKIIRESHRTTGLNKEINRQYLHMLILSKCQPLLPPCQMTGPSPWLRICACFKDNDLPVKKRLVLWSWVAAKSRILLNFVFFTVL